MRPILFSLGRLNFYSYGFFTALGFIVAGFLVQYLCRRKRLITRKYDYFLVDALLFGLICAIIAARIGYIILYTVIFRLETLVPAGLLKGGFVFYIGLAAGLLAFTYWIRREKETVLPWLDALIVGIFAGLSLSEIGGYFNDGLIVHLAGTVGSAAAAGLLYLRLTTEKRAGQTFWPGLFLLFLLYFFLGFWRTEDILWLGLNLTQWASLAGMASLAWLTVRSFRS